MLREESRGRLSGLDDRVVDQPAEERQVRRHARDLRFGQRGSEAPERVVAVASPRHDLCEERVVGEADLVALLDARIHADTVAVREQEALHASDLGQEGPRILRVETRLDSVPARLVARGRDRLADGDTELLRDEVEAGHRLRHRVLDLDPAVQLEEVEVVPIEHELHRAGAPVADRRAEGDRGLVECSAQLARQAGCGRLLEHLLVAALDGAVALAERDDRAVRVSQELHLHVPRALQVALVVEGSVSECAGGLAARSRRRVRELGLVANDAHSTAAASRGCLDDEREADLDGCTIREHRHARLTSDALRLELVSSEPERLRRRPDPGEPGRLDRFRERRVLREEAVARVDRISTHRPGGAEVLVDVEVARDRDELVGGARMERARVVGGRDRDGRDSEFVAGAEDPHRDLAAIRDEQLGHRHARTLCSVEVVL